MHHRFAAALADAWGRIRAIQARGPRRRLGRHPAALAADRAAHAEGLDRAGRGRRHPGRRHLALAPGAAVRRPGQPGAPARSWRSGCGRTARRSCSTTTARPTELVRRANPTGDLRMSATPHANGGLLTRDLDLPDFRDYAVDVPSPAPARAESTRKLGRADARHLPPQPGPVPAVLPRRDQQQPARRGVRGLRPRVRGAGRPPTTSRSSRDGRVMEVLSEHNCHGWLEGYTLTGRHGLFATYEAFAMVSASQTVQHGKWLQEAAHLPWRAKVPSLNVLLTSTAWRNDHNGFSPPGPGPDPERAHPARRRRPGLPAAGRQLPAVGGRPLPPVAVVRQPDRHRQAAAAAVADRWTRRSSTAPAAPASGTWAGTDDGTGRPRHRAGLRRRRRHDGDRRGRADPARAAAGPADAGGQRRRPDDAAAAEGPPARHGRDPVPRAVHRHRRRRLRLPRLPGRDPPARARPARRRPVPGARLRRGGHHDDAVRHGRAQPGLALPPGDGRDQQRPAHPAGRQRAQGVVRGSSWPSTRPTSSSTSRTCPRCATGRSATGPNRPDPAMSSPSTRRTSTPSCSTWTAS